jgi:hypothetical protein
MSNHARRKSQAKAAKTQAKAEQARAELAEAETKVAKEQATERLSLIPGPLPDAPEPARK